MRHEYSLDALNFFLDGVRRGLGPYLANFLESYAEVVGCAPPRCPKCLAAAGAARGTRDRQRYKTPWNPSHSCTFKPR
jgi:hypothetical protein